MRPGELWRGSRDGASPKAKKEGERATLRMLAPLLKLALRIAKLKIETRLQPMLLPGGKRWAPAHCCQRPSDSRCKVLDVLGIRESA